MNLEKLRLKVDELRSIVNQDKCFYCGEFADSMDHVIPHSFTRLLNQPRQYRTGVLPCCLECNNLLSNSIQETIEERLDMLHRRLIQRYKKILNSRVKWTPCEIDQLGYNLKKLVLKKQFERTKLLRRLKIANRITLIYTD